MNPEKEIVNLWLNRNGFYTMTDVSAKNRIIDIIAVRKGVSPIVWHLEVACSVVPGSGMDRKKDDLSKKFTDPNVVSTVKQAIKDYGATSYEKVLVTTQRIELPQITVMPFHSILLDSMSCLGTGHHSDPVIRTMQLIKNHFLSSPQAAAYLIGTGGENSSSTKVERESFAKSLLSQVQIRRLLGKKENEQTLINLLKESSLRQPERLADALDKVLTPRTAAKFFNVLLQRKQMKSALLEEVTKDSTLQQFIK